MATIPGSGAAALTTGGLWLGATLAFLFVDPSRAWQTQEDFYRAVAAEPVLYQLPRVLLTLTAFVGLATVPGIYNASTASLVAASPFTYIAARSGVISAKRSWEMPVSARPITTSTDDQCSQALSRRRRAPAGSRCNSILTVSSGPCRCCSGSL